MSSLLALIGALLPIVLVLFIIVFALRGRVRVPDLSTLREPPARQITPTATFADVGGLDTAVNELQHIIRLLHERPRGVYLPGGVLLTGDPGTGKTLLAHALGNEAGVPFWEAAGCEFGNLLIGVPALRLRNWFKAARQQTPCILFIDQLDAIGHTRIDGGSMEQGRQILNQLCAELDQQSPIYPVLVVAATSRPDLLDPALLRSGRLERHIHLPHPNAAGRAQILRIHTQQHPLGADVDLAALAEQTDQWVGADLARLVNEAALIALQNGRKAITSSDFAQALPRI